MGNQLRHGGDVKGLVDSLDYLQGMGIKGIYIAGTPHINMPWGADGYSPLDLTLLDRHFGDIEEWRKAITEIHARDMYVVLDCTVATMGDLIGFEGYLNTTTPFTLNEHKVQWKSDRRYRDFEISNNYKEECNYPRFWQETGSRVYPPVKGCYDDDFDHYGDTEAFGIFPDWQRQLSKFASVQDRLREWKPSVARRIEHFACITIAMLDIDGFRIDKATQITVDMLGDWSDSVRQCARRFGKENFFIPGEITGGDTFGSIYLGRGRQPDMRPVDVKEAFSLTGDSDNKYFIRKEGKNALDAGAFHYSVYRSLTRFLGMDGNLTAGFDTPGNWVDMWNTMAVSNDLVNANTGQLDPRHMYGVTNQDVFRWPAIKNGEHKMLLGLFITTLVMPGIPKLLWGEEQAMYLLDNTADNYIFGRQAMSSALAWQNHGCYKLGSSQYFNFPLDKALRGCEDDWNSLDHRDPSNVIRNVLKAMYHMRLSFPTLNDGFQLEQLSNLTQEIFLPGSGTTPTETGIWSVVRGNFDGVQNLGELSGGGNQSVWLVFSNNNKTTEFEFDCDDANKNLLAPFKQDTVVQNLFFPYEEYTLKASKKEFFVDSVKEFRGCLDSLEMPAWGFKALVPKEKFVGNRPSITKFSPGHDARIVSKVAPGKSQDVEIGLTFTHEMDCDNLKEVISISSRTERPEEKARFEDMRCEKAQNITRPKTVGAPPGAFTFKATLKNVYEGIHTVTVRNASADSGRFYTSAIDHFLFRIGQRDNPIVFPRTANYTLGLLHKEGERFYVSQKAAGADLFRYSTNWGSSWSAWQNYRGGNFTIDRQSWSGTKKQKWKGEHIIMQYWSEPAGSSDHIQHADFGLPSNFPVSRRFPHLFLHGPFNLYGYDAGTKNEMKLLKDGKWKFDFMAEWPTRFHFNVWGMNRDGKPDSTFVYGDINRDGVLDRMPPSSLAESVVNVTAAPPKGYLSYRIILDDGTYNYRMIPAGSSTVQIIIFALLFAVPVLSGFVAVWTFVAGFYQVKTNTKGIAIKRNILPIALAKSMFYSRLNSSSAAVTNEKGEAETGVDSSELTTAGQKRPSVLIATLEYDIEDWAIKIKIGGLGVMAQLMGKNLGHQDLIWVVPCVGGVDYPVDTPAESIEVTILGQVYVIAVQYHILNNITYVLLDAPVFRKQTKAEPYPPRMDDLESAIFYSAWNQCIAVVIKRFPIDLYHINDYHGALAPVHLLPETIPAVLSLHNAEFQGLWPLRTPKEKKEVCSVFNISQELCEKYVQFGDVFNLLHAGASYLRVHQRGYGAVGVSAKYGKRSWARYPIFWGLSGVGELPNPDPTDTADYDPSQRKSTETVVDAQFEAGRAELKRQAQEWAGLEQNPDAELLVFVGRWSMQKGIDLIADVAPQLLKEHKNLQLLCVGPVIDLYGKFAAMKLQRLMEFTSLPPFIFSGAEFALIPSRDEPFGLVAVEFGRKGALGIGARVGGLGNMPGWWFTIESTTPAHLLAQFEAAIREALSSPLEVRARMRATSAKQRFPVMVWVKQLERLQAGAKRYTRILSAAPSELSLQPPRPAYLTEGQLTPPPGEFGSSSESDNEITPADQLLPPPPRAQIWSSESANSSTLSLATVVGERRDYCLQQVNANFTDADGSASKAFEQELARIDEKSGRVDLCIEEYLMKWEKKWFNEMRLRKLGMSSPNISRSDVTTMAEGSRSASPSGWDDLMEVQGFKPPTGLKRFMMRKIGDWPLYSFFLAIGQIIAANSYQITLLTDQVSLTADRLYVICSIYIGASIAWWFVFRHLKSVWCLSLPFVMYGLAFFLVGLSVLPPLFQRRYWLGNVGTGFYAAASASGSLYFALNFGDEGGSPVKDWVYRACLIQGTQQIYVVALWYWGSKLTSRAVDGVLQDSAPSPLIAAIIIPLAVAFWAISLILWFGLPDYYRQLPGKVPAFYSAILRRNIVKWFFVAVVIQNYWLSAPYGRNWTYLWSSTHVSQWKIALLVVLFFIIIWAGILKLFAILSKEHSWILPVFAIGLGAPRWCQMFWGISNIGVYLPWTGGPEASALIGRSLWLWLGVLDSIQGVGLGMILLQTLTRMHVAFTLIGAQVFGSLATIAARATAPNNIGPGDVFPDFTSWRFGESAEVFGKIYFYVGLGFQILVCVGYLKFFRKEQLTKP
ncbi:unnamed protein product [Tuber melanosporum]|uniref:alpha-1,3-glucan synthase n=1 Tax=Tuber melanosporum (strain Mel28) TaxID=656061 RepID=D5G7E7_TUBMM|nr:uncharacterized protein GSTUM_00002531001 [Tuber melanosporum]CAZ80440.1 unnamed protein product [Tuber melanosporum]